MTVIKVRFKRNFALVALHDFSSVKAVALRNILNSRKHNQLRNSLIDELGEKFLNLAKSGSVPTVNNRYILMEFFPLPLWATVNAAVANLISKKMGAAVFGFSFSTPARDGKQLFNSLGVSKFLIISQKISKIPATFAMYRGVLKTLTDANSVFEIRVDKVQIGVDIYESILRRGKATVSINDHETYIQIFRAIKQYIFFKDRFEKQEIVAVLLSHDNYIGPGLLSRMAYTYDVPVILANIFSITTPTQPFQLYSIFPRYREYFSQIILQEQRDAIALSKAKLGKRLSGELKIGMAYQEKSAFENSSVESQLRVGTNLKVIILTHDFYDNPHGYGRMLFDDFLLWLNFLGELSSDTKYDWYIKTHRDFSDAESIEVQKFVARFPNIHLVNSETSFLQLAREGIRFALTCYGTVGHELPLLGITVINASYNPHVAYGFNHHAKSISHYEEMIRNLENYEIHKFDENEIYEFYYVHNNMLSRDDFILRSFEELNRDCDGDFNSNFLIKHITSELDSIICNVELRAIELFNSHRVFSHESILPEDVQTKVPISTNNSAFYRAFDDGTVQP